jgi:hypothetical protein
MRGVLPRCRPESAAVVLSENPRLASADETQRQFLQKFIYCQKSRLRVREAAVQASLLASCNVDREAVIDIANNENHYSRSVSCNSAKMTAISSADFLHQRACDFVLLQLPFVAGSRLYASILP